MNRNKNIPLSIFLLNLALTINGEFISISQWLFPMFSIKTVSEGQIALFVEVAVKYYIVFYLFKTMFYLLDGSERDRINKYKIALSMYLIFVLLREVSAFL
ncbi:hypothetical protein [Anaerolentibacter hominis]|uniref:hypothetical protein n=1 Tax=Anaerolentibacter hominis TaxID=3079009 RepID=UPI0031B8A38B